MRLTVSFFTDEVDSDFVVALRKGKQAGADAVEIRGKLFGRTVATLGDAEMERIREALKGEGLRVAAIGSPFGKCYHDRPQEVEQHQLLFQRMLELARFLDAPVIRGFAFWKPGGPRYDGVRPDLEAYLPPIVEFLRPAVEAAARSGKVLALETEDATMIGNCREAMQVIEALGQPQGVAITWDVNNAWHTGEEPTDGYREARGWIRHVHVKPNRRGNLETVAESRTSYREVLQWLLADGYAGAVSIEHWGAPEAMLDGIRQLRSLVEEVGRE